MQFTQVEKLIGITQQMIDDDGIIQLERAEQRGLSGLLASHQRGELHCADGGSVIQLQPAHSTEFFNGIGRNRKGASRTLNGQNPQLADDRHSPNATIARRTTAVARTSAATLHHCDTPATSSTTLTPSRSTKNSTATRTLGI